MCLHAYESTPLDGDWKFHWGDDPYWFEMAFDDSQWQHLTPPISIRQQHGQATTGWYRLRFDAFVDVTEPQTLVIEHLRHADETWINGIKVGGEGRFSEHWQWPWVNPQQLMRMYYLPPGFLQPHNNLLAIKVSAGIGPAWGAQFPGGVGILKDRVYLGEPDDMQLLYQQHIVQSSAVDAVFFALGLAHVLLIVFLLRNNLNQFIEFKWLFVSSVVLLAYSLGQDFFFINGFQKLPASVLFGVALLLTPTTVAMYFFSQYQNLAVRWVHALLSASLIIIVLLLLPVSTGYKVWIWYGWLLLAVLFWLYAVCMAVYAVYKGHLSAVTQLFAIVVFSLALLLEYWPHISWGHRNIQMGAILFCYAILFAYFQKLRNMRLNYKALSSRIVNVVDETNSKVARELHDSIGQYIASTKLQVQLLRQMGDNPHLAIIEEEVDNSTSGLRRLINGLHPAMIDRYDLKTLLEKESARMMSSFSVRISLQGDWPESFTSSTDHSESSIKLNMFRIFQEAVLNAVRHGHANNIDVLLQSAQKELSLEIRDDGQGFVVDARSAASDDSGFGFISLHERVALLNGEIHMHSQQNVGSVVVIKLPLIEHQ